MKPTVSGTVRSSFALVISGLLWLGVLGGAAAQGPVLAFTEVAPFVTDPTVPCTPTSCPVGPHDTEFSPDGSLLAVVNESSHSLAIFKVGAGGTLTEVPPFPIRDAGMRAPNSVDFSPSGKLLATVNISSNNVSVFRVGEGGTLTLVGNFGTGVSVPSGGTGAYWGAWSPNGRWFAVANRSANSVTMFEVKADDTFTPFRTFQTGGQQTNAVAFSRDGKLFATGNINTNNVSMFKFDEANGHEDFVGRFSTGLGGESAWNIAFSPDGGLLATANPGDNSVSVFRVLNRDTGQLDSPVRTELDPGRCPRAVEFSPGGTLLATADFGFGCPNGTGGTASVFSVGTGGALTPVNGSPFPAGAGSKHTSFTPNGDLFATADYGSNTVTVYKVAAVEITKRARARVDPGGVVSYTVTVTNTGALRVGGPVVDDLEGILGRATLVGTPTATTGTVSVDLRARTLTWNGTLEPAGGSPDSVTIHYSVRVHRHARGVLHDRLTGPPDSTCTSNAGGMLGPECVVETQIVPPAAPGADLALTKTASVSSIHPGGQVLYTLTVHNNGPGDATDVVLQDPLPPGLVFGSARATVGTCTIQAAQLVCRLGTIPAGGGRLVLVTATVTRNANHTLTNTASVNGRQDDPNHANNTASSRVTVRPEPTPPPDPGPQPVSDLVITKRVNHARHRVGVGKELSYTITVTNRGHQTAGDVRVIDAFKLPVRALSRHAHPSRGSCHGTRPVRCILGTLAPHARATITIHAIAAIPGTQINAASVMSGSWDPDTATNIAVAHSHIFPRPPHHHRHHRPRFTG